jgi:transcriptional regulator with XRE-family HTH domain
MKSLREKIKESGYKKSFVAERLGINIATLSRILSGKQPYISEELQGKIDRLFEVQKIE